MPVQERSLIPNGRLKATIATLTGQHWREKGCGLGDIAGISKISGPDAVSLRGASAQPEHLSSVTDPAFTGKCETTSWFSIAFSFYFFISPSLTTEHA